MNPRKIFKKYLFFSIYFIEFVEFFHSFYKFLRYSGVFIYPIKQNKLLGRIIEGYHSVERSLALPNVRVGFAKEHVLHLIELNMLYYKKFGLNSTQIVHSVEVVNEYQIFHKEKGFHLDEKINIKIEELKILTGIVSYSSQIHTTANDYFENYNASFDTFSESRKSVRKYSEVIVENKVLFDAFTLAQNAPSACNRQGARIHLVEDHKLIKEVLNVHIGTGGFKAGVKKLIVLTEDLEVSNGVFEKNQIYTDGGIFLMSLLYSLHYYKIAACPLNNSFSVFQDLKIRKILDVKNSECFIAFISVGYPAENMVVTTSRKRDLTEILTLHS